MVNKTMIRERLTLIKEYVDRLERLSQIPLKEFIGNDSCAAAESYLRRSLEAIFDIGRHIVAKGGYIELAQEYRSIAKGLQELHVVDPPLGRKLVKMAGYRNRMVHFYNLITDEEIYAIISRELGDIRSFLLQVKNYLDNLSEKID